MNIPTNLTESQRGALIALLWDGVADVFENHPYRACAMARRLVNARLSSHSRATEVFKVMAAFIRHEFDTRGAEMFRDMVERADREVFR